MDEDGESLEVNQLINVGLILIVMMIIMLIKIDNTFWCYKPSLLIG